ncbi:MAG: hypothetical protein SVX43_08930, partial [Cyanobacteriota bacterium]|nr:hypothetical protein [Cyanobacteriota bacterium]
MNHHSPSNNPSPRSSTRRSLVRRGAVVASSLTLLSSGLVVAQTDSLVDSGASPEPAPAAPVAPQPAPAPPRII